MGNNFYTKWVDGTTVYSVASMDPPLASLDQVIGYHHNPIIHTDGLIEYDQLTGKLSWTDTIRLYFNAADGTAVSNTISASSVTLSDNQFAYCTLNDTDTTVITVSGASVTLASASNFIAAGIVVLGYRNTASDNYFPVALPLFDGTITSEVQTTDATATTLASKTLTEGKAYFVEGKVVGREGDITETGLYVLRALVSRQTAGGAALESEVEERVIESSSAVGWDVSIDVDTNDVRLRVTGVASTTVNWKGKLSIIEV
jgi:hypothetical protein